MSRPILGSGPGSRRPPPAPLELLELVLDRTVMCGTQLRLRVRLDADVDVTYAQRQLLELVERLAHDQLAERAATAAEEDPP